MKTAYIVSDVLEVGTPQEMILGSKTDNVGDCESHFGICVDVIEE